MPLSRHTCHRLLLLWGAALACQSAPHLVHASAVYQPLPFSQNWNNTALLNANDDWSGVPGIVGYL
ncbi:MAG: hypothetical protein FD129_1081, partial [bacterium]